MLDALELSHSWQVVDMMVLQYKGVPTVRMLAFDAGVSLYIIDSLTTSY